MSQRDYIPNRNWIKCLKTSYHSYTEEADIFGSQSGLVYMLSNSEPSGCDAFAGNYCRESRGGLRG